MDRGVQQLTGSALPRSSNIGVDTGGTFTDFVMIGDDGVIRTDKAFSTPDAPERGIFNVLGRAAAALNTSVPDILARTGIFAHGTTVSTNALITRRGAKVGVLFTSGFEDTLAIGRGPIGRVGGLPQTQAMDFLHTEPPTPLVPQDMIRGVCERIDAAGKMVIPLDVITARLAIQELVDAGAESLAICLLWAFRNPEHEEEVAALSHEIAPNIPVSLSHEIAPRMGEFERAVTTVINAYIGPVTERYVHDLNAGLAAKGLTHPVQVITSTGGAAQAADMGRRAVSVVNSGPVAGLVAARFLGNQLGHRKIITADMGGTSFDVGLINGHTLEEDPQPFLDQGLPVSLPAVKLVTIGAGGGSIAWTDGYRLQVGPQSAGADPGPACYGRGNDRPTVTDANFVLGYLNPNGLVGGGLGIDRRLSEKAIMDKVGTPLGLDVVQAAAGIRKIANVAMARAIRSVTVERGRDPRDMALMAFGGSGPVHAVEVAGLLGIRKVIVPAMSGVFSSVGMLASDVEHNFVRTLLQPFSRLDASQFREVTTRLREDGIGRLSADGFAESQIQLSFGADVRYLGQSSELTVRMEPESVLKLGFDTLESAFHTAYNETYGYKNDEAVELVSIRLSARGIRESRLSFRGIDSQVVPLDIADDERTAWFAAAGDYVVTPTRGRTIISEGRVNGPAILEAYDTTIVIPPDATAVSDGCGSVVIDVPDSAMV